MAKPVDSVILFDQQNKGLCVRARRLNANQFKCNVVQRAVGNEACTSEDWGRCPLNDGGKLGNKGDALA